MIHIAGVYKKPSFWLLLGCYRFSVISTLVSIELLWSLWVRVERLLEQKSGEHDLLTKCFFYSLIILKTGRWA